MSLIALITNLCMAAYWFFDWPEGRFHPESTLLDDNWNLIDWAGPMAVWLEVYLLGFILCAIWHFFDFLHRRDADKCLTAIFTRYWAFAIVLTITGILFILEASGEFDHNPCSEMTLNDPNRFGFDACPTMASPWLAWSTAIVMLLLVALTFGKGVVAIASHFKKT